MWVEGLFAGIHSVNGLIFERSEFFPLPHERLLQSLSFTI